MHIVGGLLAWLLFSAVALAQGTYPSPTFQAPTFNDPATTRTNLGLGTMATQNANAAAITGGTAILGTATINGPLIGGVSNIVSTPTYGVGNEALRIITTRSGDAAGFTARLVDIQDTANVKNNVTGGAVDTVFINTNFGGTSNPAHSRSALTAYIQDTSATTSNGPGYYQGLSSTFTVNYGNGGTVGTSFGVYQGAASIAITAPSTGPGGTLYLNALQGAEHDVALGSGQHSDIKVGLTIASGVGVPAGSDFAHGTYTDAALNIAATTANDVGFNTAINIGQQGTGWPVTSSGTVLGTGSALSNAKTAAHGIDLSTITFSSDAFKSTNFSVDGYGNISTNGFQMTSNSTVANIVATYGTCNAGNKAKRGVVSDAAAAPTFWGVPTGGGSLTAPIWCNGSAWVYG